MPDTPERSVRRTRPATNLRRLEHGQIDPTHRKNAAQEDGEEERHSGPCHRLPARGSRLTDVPEAWSQRAGSPVNS